MERSSNANEEVHSNTQKAALVIVFWCEPGVSAVFVFANFHASLHLANKHMVYMCTLF